MVQHRPRLLVGSLLFLTGVLAGCGGDSARPFGGGDTGGTGSADAGGNAGGPGTGGGVGTGGATGGAGQNGSGGSGGTIATGGNTGSGGRNGSGGATATGGRMGTGGGGAGTGGVSGTGGRAGTGGSGSTPGSGGSGSTPGSGGTGSSGGNGGRPGTGGTGSAMGSGGTGGANQASCDMIAYAYMAEMPKAKMCIDVTGLTQCMHPVSASLGCGSSCITYVQTPDRLNEIAGQWRAAGCDQIPRTCPAIICAAVSSAKCVAMAASGPMCVDNYGGPSI